MSSSLSLARHAVRDGDGAPETGEDGAEEEDGEEATRGVWG
jgi:hypothetical protein